MTGRSSAFTARFHVSLDRDLFDKLEFLIDDGDFASRSNAFKKCLREWIKRHKGSRFLYLPLDDYIKEKIKKEDD